MKVPGLNHRLLGGMHLLMVNGRKFLSAQPSPPARLRSGFKWEISAKLIPFLLHRINRFYSMILLLLRLKKVPTSLVCNTAELLMQTQMVGRIPAGAARQILKSVMVFST